jgi:hypothetical protein
MTGFYPKANYRIIKEVNADIVALEGLLAVVYP